MVLSLLFACNEYDLNREGDADGGDDRGADVSADGPYLQITPNPLDFGIIGVDCEDVGTVTLENVGQGSLTIDELSLDGEDIFLITELDLPSELRPGASVQVEVGFAPSTDGDFSATLSVDSNDPRGVVTAEQLGEGSLVGSEHIDSWELADNPPTDIMFSLDSSCSMSSDIWTMSNNFDPFIDLLQALTGDWQIIVANDDDGCAESGVMRPGNPNYSDQFKSDLFAFNWNADYTEALLSVNEAGIQNSDNLECNDGFLREGAMLHIIDISDEPEQSMQETGRDWQELVDSIISKKGDPALVTISAIAGDVPNGCDDAAPGTGYAEAVDYTGGVFLSICDEWQQSSNLAALAQASVNQHRFTLSNAAVEETIEVFVNGSSRTDWIYDELDWIVEITGEAPSSGDEIIIEYQSVDGC